MTGAGSFHRATQCFSHHKWCFLLLLFLGISFLGFCPEVTENLEENLNRETWKKIIIFLSWLLPLVSVLYCHPVRKVSLPYIQDTVIGTSTSWLPIKTMAFSLSCLFTSSISFTSQFLKKCRKTMENSDMLAPVHYDAKVTPQNPNTILNISHPWCACLSQRRHREQIKMFFSCGAQELPTCLITKKMLLMQYVTMERSHFTLCSCCTSSLCFSTLKTRTLHSSICGKHWVHSLATLLFIVFSVQSSKGDVLLDQFVLLFDFLLSSNLVNLYYFAFLTDTQFLLASLLTGPSPLMSFFTTTQMVEKQIVFILKKGCPNLEIHALKWKSSSIPTPKAQSHPTALQPWDSPFLTRSGNNFTLVVTILDSSLA